MYLFLTLFRLSAILGVLVLLNGCIPQTTKQTPKISEEIIVPLPIYEEIDGAKHQYVQSHETLASIAQDCGCSVNDIIQWNNIQSPYRIQIAQYLQIEAPVKKIIPPKATPTITAGLPVKPFEPAKSTLIIPSVKGKHTVKEGETLLSIAQQYDFQPTELAVWNDIKEASEITVGQILTVIPPIEALPSLETESAISHIVLEGDDLSKLATHYSVSESDLIAWNNLQAPYKLSLGQILLLAEPLSDEIVEYHTVDFGETLFGIAQYYDHNIKDLARWNNLSPPYQVDAGQRLRLTAPAQDNLHIVKPGETLQSIADTYGVLLTDLALWNELGKPYTVYPGMKVKFTAH